MTPGIAVMVHLLLKGWLPEAAFLSDGDLACEKG